MKAYCFCQFLLVFMTSMHTDTDYTRKIFFSFLVRVHLIFRIQKLHFRHKYTLGTLRFIGRQRDDYGEKTLYDVA